MFNGTNFPFTFAPLVFIPTSVCIANAKSKGVAPFGRDFRSPVGVNTKISFEYKFNLNSFKKNIENLDDRTLRKKLINSKKVRQQILSLKQDIAKPDFGRDQD